MQSTTEEWYDAEIAPRLKELADKCGAKGLAFVAVVEYAPGERGETFVLPEGTGLAMIMLQHCAKMGANIDGFIMGLKEYAAEKGIDTGASIYLSR